jgi:oxaloacetate decarboxylase alpha subunit
VHLFGNVGGITHTIEVDDGNDSGSIRVRVNGREYVIDVTTPAPGSYSLLVNGQVYSAIVVQRRGRREVQIGAWSTSVDIGAAQGGRPSARSPVAVSGRQEITAPMSGRIVQVLVPDGQIVEAGESLVIIEAMKMETEIRSPAPGKVKEIQVEAGMTVEAGQVLLVVEGN